MKKLIMSVAVVMFLVVPVASAQTVPISIASGTPPSAAIQILEQELLSLYQQLIVLLQQQNQLQATQSVQAGQITTLEHAATTSQSLGSAAPSRPFTISEEARVNFGNGFAHDADIQNFEISTVPGQEVSGELVARCSYNSYVQGLSNSCTVPSGSTSSLPTMANAHLTLQFTLYDILCPAGSGPVQYTESVNTDAQGNFSFTIPSDTSTIHYQLTIYNGSKPVLWFQAKNKNAPSYSNACK